MEITFNTPREFVVQEEKTKTVNSVKIIQFTDSFNKVECTISFGDGSPKYLLLWEGEAYTNIGQYTDSDIQNRILELI